MTMIRFLKSLDACRGSIEWAETQPDMSTAWNNCERGDWLIWLVSRVCTNKQAITLTACACARIALQYAQGPNILEAIETAEAWAKGEATIEQVKTAANAAYDSGYSHLSYDDECHINKVTALESAAEAAAAAADTACLSDALIHEAAAAAAFYAADAAYFASSDPATCEDARVEVQRKCANIVRSRFSWPIAV